MLISYIPPNLNNKKIYTYTNKQQTCPKTALCKNASFIKINFKRKNCFYIMSKAKYFP